MQLSALSFRGEAPRVTPRALPDNAAQAAVNTYLLTGDLQSFSQFVKTAELANLSPVATIYLLAGLYWLSFTEEVEIAKGIIPGDTTHRTYITGLDVPRWTNVDMATGGPQPWPFETRPLGVPNPDTAATLVAGIDPTPTTFSVDVLDDGDSLSSNWTISGTTAGVSEVTQDAVVGNPAPSYALLANGNAGIPAYAYRNFGIASGTVVQVSFDWSYQLGAADAQMIANIMTGSLGIGIQVRYDSNLARFSISTATGWASQGSSSLTSDTVSPLLSHSTWYTVDAQVLSNGDGTQTVTARLFQGSGLLYSLTVTNTFSLGDYVGFVHETSSGGQNTYYDNIHVQASGSTGFVPEDVATSYVWTLINDVGEESGPSPPSSTVLRPDGVSVTVTTPTSIPTGISSEYGITNKRIYRAVTGNTGTFFAFVAEIPLSQADYVDVLTDAQLGEALESEGWDLPPDNMRNIMALANGIMVGSSGNQLCLSARNRPHAWPPAYRLTTDTDIAGLGAIDTTVVIGTQSYPYIASGNDPAAFSMNKIEVKQACVSRRSFASVSDIGVIFASPDGLISVAGTGLLRILTVDIFTREQWQLLRPETITATAHDDTYWFFYEGDPGSGFSSGDVSRAGYALDMSPTGFGLVSLAFHAEAIYSNPETDNFYLALDSDNEPTDPLLPVPSSEPTTVDGLTIYQFDADPGSKMVARWRSKLFMLRRPGCMQYVQVRAASYANTVARFYKGTDTLFYTKLVTSDEPFTIPMDDLYGQFFFEILTTDRIYEVQAAERIEEFQ